MTPPEVETSSNKFHGTPLSNRTNIGISISLHEEPYRYICSGNFQLLSGRAVLFSRFQALRLSFSQSFLLSLPRPLSLSRILINNCLIPFALPPSAAIEELDTAENLFPDKRKPSTIPAIHLDDATIPPDDAEAIALDDSNSLLRADPLLQTFFISVGRCLRPLAGTPSFPILR